MLVICIIITVVPFPSSPMCFPTIINSFPCLITLINQSNIQQQCTSPFLIGIINVLLFSTHMFCWFVGCTIHWMFIKSFRELVEGGVLDGALLGTLLFFINVSIISIFQTEWKNNFYLIMGKRDRKNTLLQSSSKDLEADKQFDECKLVYWTDIICTYKTIIGRVRFM